MSKIVKKFEYMCVDVSIIKEKNSYYYRLDALPYPSSQSIIYTTVENAELMAKCVVECLSALINGFGLDFSKESIVKRVTDE